MAEAKFFMILTLVAAFIIATTLTGSPPLMIELAVGIGVIITVVAWFKTGTNKFPLNVHIYENRAGKGTVISFDKAGLVADKHTGRAFYQLKKRKKYIPSASYGSIYSAGKHQIMMLNARNADDFVPMKVSLDDKPTIKMQDEQEIARKIAYTQAIVNTNTKFQEKGFFERYMPLIALIIFAFATAIMLWATGQYMERIAGSLGQVASSMTQAADAVKSAGVGAPF